jgi:hypothetical protein
MSVEDSAGRAHRDTFAVKNRVGAALLVGFCCWHAAFLIVSILPRAGPEERGNAAMNLYRILVSGQQQWNVFETIPLLHSFDARIEMSEGEGRTLSLGSVMPGFAAYPRPENARYYNVFYRMLLGSAESPFFEAYLRRMDEQIRSRHGGSFTGHWALVVDVEWTRILGESRRGGALYLPAKRAFDIAHRGGITPLPE